MVYKCLTRVTPFLGINVTIPIKIIIIKKKLKRVFNVSGERRSSERPTAGPGQSGHARRRRPGSCARRSPHPHPHREEEEHPLRRYSIFRIPPPPERARAGAHGARGVAFDISSRAHSLRGHGETLPCSSFLLRRLIAIQRRWFTGRDS